MAAEQQGGSGMAHSAARSTAVPGRSGGRSTRSRRALGDVRQRALGSDSVDLASELLQRVQTVVTGVLGAEVAAGQPLMEAGLDSLGDPCLHLAPRPASSGACLQLTKMLSTARQCCLGFPECIADQHATSRRGVVCGGVSGKGAAGSRGGGGAAGAVELRTGLAAEFRLDLPATVTFDYPSSSALAAFIAAQLTDATGVGGHVGIAEASRCTLAIADSSFAL